MVEYNRCSFNGLSVVISQELEHQLLTATCDSLFSEASGSVTNEIEVSAPISSTPHCHQGVCRKETLFAVTCVSGDDIIILYLYLCLKP